MAFERSWKAVPARVFTQDGTDSGEINVGTTCGFKAKQVVIVSATGEDSLQLEVKRVLSPTLLLVGPVDRGIDQVSDISAYTVAKNAQVRALQQNKKGPGNEIIERTVYEAEPTVAYRTVNVDKFGRSLEYTEDGSGNLRVPVDGDFNVSGKSAGETINIAVATALVEDSITIPAGTKAFWMQIKDAESGFVIGFVDNATFAAPFDINRGNVYIEEDLKLDSDLTLYYHTKKDNVTIQLKLMS